MRWLIPAIICHLALCGCLIGAQEPSAAPAETKSTPPAASAAATGSERIEELQPPVYYVPDKRGELVPLLGFTFDDFMGAFSQMHGLLAKAPPPKYVLEKLSAVGRVEAGRAALTVHCDVVSRHDGWVRVPLDFSRAVVQGDVRHEGKGETFLEFAPGGDGYVCWIRGNADQRHQLTLKLLLPVENMGDETRLQFRAPDATQSELKLTVPLPDSVGSASAGAVLRTGTPPDKTHTEFIVEGFRDHFQIAWHKPDVRISQAPTVLEVAGEMRTRIDDHSVNTEATLRVRGHGEPFDRFQVRLPPGAELLAASPSGYSVTMVTSDSATADAGRLVEVQLREKTSGPVTVRLATRREHDRSSAASWIELAGFDVLGAARQLGHIGVEVAGDLYVLWDPKLGVQQIDQLPEALQGEDLTAGFEYFVQPCSLMARMMPRTTRVSVEPEYLVLVDAAQIQLEATLQYTVRGKKALVLDVTMGEWEFDEVGPENLVAVDGVEVTDSGLLSIPLLQPSTGQITLTLKAHRRIPRANQSLRLTFPRPKVTSSRPAQVVVLPADNVQLTPDTEAIVGLTRQEVAPPMKLPKRQQSPLFYRGDVAGATLVVDRTVHAGTIAVNVRSDVALAGRAGEVQQRFSYQIDYEPQGKLAVAVPRSLIGLEGLTFRLDGQALPASAITENVGPKGRDTESPARVEIALPSARIGECELTVRYPLAPSNLVPKSAVLRHVPLLMPLDGHLLSNKLRVTSPPEFQVKPPGAPWKPQTEGMKADVTATPGRQSELDVVTTEPTSEVELGVYLDARNTPGATVVQRAWIQTWLTDLAREDRVLFRFTTDRKEVTVALPSKAAGVEVSLDGHPVQPMAADARQWVVALPAGGVDHEWLMDVRYHCPETRSGRGRLMIDLPRLGADTWTRRMYWQLTLPPDEHVVDVSSGFVGEFRWGWNGIFWGREPLLSQSELDTWIGIAPDSGVSQRTNSYLFSTLGNVSQCELRTAGRSSIVLGASGAALVAGLLLIYVPVLRHPASLLLAAVVLGAVGTCYPEPTLLILQAASLGLALALLAGLLERSMKRRRRSPIIPSISSSILDKDSTQTQYPVPPSAHGSTTEPLITQKPAST